MSYIVAVLLRVLGCFPIVYFYTKGGFRCGGAKMSDQQPAARCQRPLTNSQLLMYCFFQIDKFAAVKTEGFKKGEQIR